MNNLNNDRTFADTGIPTSAIKQSFAKGSCEHLFEDALKVLDLIAVKVIRSIKTIKQAEKAYKKAEAREEKDAILIRWIILCKTSEELADPMMRSPRQSLPEAVALQRVTEFKFAC